MFKVMLHLDTNSVYPELTAVAGSDENVAAHMWPVELTPHGVIYAKLAGMSHQF